MQHTPDQDFSPGAMKEQRRRADGYRRQTRLLEGAMAQASREVGLALQALDAGDMAAAIDALKRANVALATR